MSVSCNEVLTKNFETKNYCQSWLSLTTQQRLQCGIVEVQIRGDGLNVVVIFQCFEQFQNCFGCFEIDIDGVGGNTSDLFDVQFHTSRFEGIDDFGEMFWRCGDFNLVITSGLNIQCPMLERYFHNLLFARADDGDQPATFEQVGHTTGAAEIATMDVEDLADFGAVRLRLSVMISHMIATPAGP